MLNQFSKRLKYDLVVLHEIIFGLIFFLPRFPLFNTLKSLSLKLMGARIGKRNIYYSGVWISNGRNLTIGDDVDLAKGVVITTRGGVTIGNRVLIGYRTQILSSNHAVPSNREKIFYAGHENKEVIIEDDVWIGANCVICPGVHIGTGAVIAAGSIVTHDIDEYAIAAGAPARIIRMRD